MAIFASLTLLIYYKLFNHSSIPCNVQVYFFVESKYSNVLVVCRLCMGGTYRQRSAFLYVNST